MEVNNCGIGQISMFNSLQVHNQSERQVNIRCLATKVKLITNSGDNLVVSY